MILFLLDVHRGSQLLEQ